MWRIRSLVLLLAAGACQRTAPAPLPGPMVPADAAAAAPREQTADQQVWHALNRLAFGPRPGDVERVRAMGVDAWIERQLALAADPAGDAATDARVAQAFPTITASIPDLLRDYPRPAQLLRQSRRMGDSVVMTREDTARFVRAQREARAVAQDAMAARVARAVASEAQLREVMVDFWLNHFSVFSGKGGPTRQYLAAYEREAIRPHALGRFRTLLGAVARSPAMLYYLDQWQSVADSGQPTLAPQPRRARRVAALAEAGRMGPLAQQLAQRRPRGLNENYARELLELHTLGVDGGYTQQDIIEVARALTGWTIDQPLQRGTFVFRAAQHDAGAKRVLGTVLPAGRGLEDGEQVLDLAARHPATARFIATKLVRRFVADTPPADLVDRAAEVFRRTDGDLTQVVRTIVRSPEFFSTAAWRAKVKSPFELVVSTVRALGGSADTTPRTIGVLARLGQPVFGHQAPNGWPETGEAWINTGSILQRINFGVAAATGLVPGASAREWPGLAAARAAPAREAQVDLVVRGLLGGYVSSDMRAVLVSGENPLLDRPMPDAPTMSAAGDPDAPVVPELPRARRRPEGDPLVTLIGLALGSPEFQRR
jgi:uncharacterized protein (DUF1800 family)